ncbi:MAG: DUF3160 domain-containing protein [Synergistaceae bacterium]|nr:DUF3160 domain-containing protein [Synergistaceae bacterium]
MNLYIVHADIAAVTETPGLPYERGKDNITNTDGLISALIYGDIVNAVPLPEGEFAGIWAEVKEGDPFSEWGKTIGYVDMAALTRLPKIEFFTKPELCRFTVDTPYLFLLPGSLSILDYTLPNDKPYYVLAGEVVGGIGTYMDAASQDWTLLRFESASSEYKFRHAWTHSENVMRLSQYEPDHTKIDPALLPSSVRGFGGVQNKFRMSILRNGFAIDSAPIIHERLILNDLVQSYPESQYAPAITPNFVTTDMFLHAFHHVYSHALKVIEETTIAPVLENMLREAFKKLNELESKSDKDAKYVFTLARDYLTVPIILYAPTQKLAKPSARAKSEIGRIMRAERIAKSVISGKNEDYTLYRPRGYYLSSMQLSRYFRAMAHLGGMSLPLNTDDPELNNRNAALTALLCIIFEDEGLRKQWNSIYEPLTFLFGTADDPTIIDYGPIVRKHLKGKIDRLTDEKTLDTLRKALIDATPAPRVMDVQTENVSRGAREKAMIGFRLFGRRFVLDEWAFAQLTSPNVGSDSSPRYLPKVADVMASLGSGVADAMLMDDRRDIPYYSAALEKVKDKFNYFLAELDENMTSLWLQVLSLYLNERDSKQYFLHSPLWELKKLLTASASWAELKHESTQYSKQNFVEMDQGDEWVVEPFGAPIPLGYVEPSPRTLGGIANALSRLQEVMEKYNLDENASNGVRVRVKNFLDLLLIFCDIAEKEVNEEPLSREDYIAISYIYSCFNENFLNENIIIKEDEIGLLKMALVSDVATDASNGQVLQAAVGAPRRIYVFVNDKWGGPRLTIGYTYSYYEFDSPQTSWRMSDDEWKVLVYDKARQNQLEELTPRWSKDLFVR